MADSVFYTRHDGGITLIRNGTQSTVSNTHANFDQILNALKLRQFDKLETLMSIERTINATGVCKTNPDRKVVVNNGKVFFIDTRNRREVELHGTLVDRILRDLNAPGVEHYADALMALLENIQKNPVKDISGELYEWLASGTSPITSDGCILAYKKVKHNFMDIYTGSMDNSPGKVVRMKQKDVDTDRSNECSRGLHFASLGYLTHYSGGGDSKVVIVKVNPRHIFAIPKDYNCQKGQASEYYVVGEYASSQRENVEAFKDSFIDSDIVALEKLKNVAPDVKFVAGVSSPAWKRSR